MAAALLVSALMLGACGGGSPQPQPEPSTPGTRPNEPVTATVSSCSAPLGSGDTTLRVGFRIDSVTQPLSLVHVLGHAAFQGSTRVDVTPTSQTPVPGGDEVDLAFSGPAFDRLVFAHATLAADAAQTVHARSIQALAGSRFRGPFGPARVTDVQVVGSKVRVQIAYEQTPVSGVQNIGPQDATLQVGSVTLAPAGSSSVVKGSKNVTRLTFAGAVPKDGPATLTVSSWHVLDLEELAIRLPADC